MRRRPLEVGRPSSVPVNRIGQVGSASGSVEPQARTTGGVFADHPGQGLSWPHDRAQPSRPDHGWPAGAGFPGGGPRRRGTGSAGRMTDRRRSGGICLRAVDDRVGPASDKPAVMGPAGAVLPEAGLNGLVQRPGPGRSASIPLGLFDQGRRLVKRGLQLLGQDLTRRRDGAPAGERPMVATSAPQCLAESAACPPTNTRVG